MPSIRKSTRTHLSKQKPQQYAYESSTDGVKASKKKQQVSDECAFPRTGRRGAPQVFPRKLFQILDEVDEDVIAWTNSQGTSFTIYDMDSFSENVLLNYFRHQKYSSFQRQLNLYGFHKISKGPETGAYAHDCFIRDKPQLLMGVRRLPQRTSSNTQVSPTKGNHKIVIKKSSIHKSQQGAFSRLTSCMKPRSSQRLHETSNSDGESYSGESSHNDSYGSESYGSEEESDSEVPNPPGFRDILGNSVDSDIQSEDINTLDFFGSSEESEEYALLENLEDDKIVRIQPLPKECIIDNSSKVVDGISEGVNQLIIQQSPIAVAKTVKSVKLPESSRIWAVKKTPPSKPLSPNSGGALQRMIPMLVRAGSSAFAIGKEVKAGDDDMMKCVIDDLQYIDTTKSNSSSVDSVKDLMPSPMSQRLTSEAWNMDSVNDQELHQFFSNGQLDTMFMRQESSDMIVPPKLVEMER